MQISLYRKIAWIDAGKGIGIILVVLGHIWLTKDGYRYINSFHVPLFFFLSGYLVNLEKYDGIRHFITEKINSILVPYFSFSIITYAYWFFVERRFSGNGVSPVGAFINIFLAPGGDQYLPHNPALWFLTCLFMVATVFYLLGRNRKLVHIVMLVAVSLVLGYATTVYLPLSSPWSIDVMPTGLVFYGVGFILKKKPLVYIQSNYVRLLVICCCVPLGIAISQLNGEVLVAENFYGNYVSFYMGAFLGITSVVMLATILQQNKILLYLGQNSMIIFALHFPVKRMVTGVTGKALHISLEEVKGSFLISSIDTIITILILVPIIFLIRNQFYFILGKKYGNNKVGEEMITSDKKLSGY